VITFKLSVVPPGGGETEYTLEMSAEHLPRSGDYIQIVRQPVDLPRPSTAPPPPEFDTKAVAFKVRYSMYSAKETSGGKVGPAEIWVSVEPVESPYQGEDHRRLIEIYRARGLTVEATPESDY
jgi:hypothetical protein